MMCTRILSKALALTTLLTLPVLGLQKAPLTEKLPPQLWGKRPVAYWGFDEKGPSLRLNRIQNLQTILLGGVRHTPEGLHQGALMFNGASGQVKIPISATSELTLSAWFLPASLSRTGFFTAFALQSSQHTLTINLHRQGTIEVQQTTPFSQGSSSINMGLGIPDQQWLHLALVATPNQLTLYLNGQSVGHFDMPVPLANAYLLVAGNTFKGSLDELALFGQTLTPQDIEAIFTLHKPALAPGATQDPQNNTWEAKSAHTYHELAQAINSGNWSAAITQTAALSDLVTAYRKDRKNSPNESAQSVIQANLNAASDLLDAFKTAIEQAKYHEASDLFDRLDEVWETLEGQLNLPVSNDDVLTGAPLPGSGRTQTTRFSQTWNSNAGAMPGSGFSGGMSMGAAGGFNSVSGGGFSMSASSGPDGQVQFNSSGIPGQEFMGQSMGQMPPQMIQHQFLMQNQRIQMTLISLRTSLQNANWQVAQVHWAHLQQLFAQMGAQADRGLRPSTRTRRRSLDGSGLPPAQRSALNAHVQDASRHLTLLNTAIEKQDLDAAYKHLQSLENVSRTLNQRPDNAVELPQPPNP